MSKVREYARMIEHVMRVFQLILVPQGALPLCLPVTSSAFSSSTVTSSVASGDWTTTSSLLSPNAPSGFNWLVFERTISCFCFEPDVSSQLPVVVGPTVVCLVSSPDLVVE